MARDEARTPLWRGLTLLQELRAANVPVAAASDNVRDWWHPYGDYDPLQVWREAVAMGHLDTAPSEGSWARIWSPPPPPTRWDVGGGRHRGGRARGPGALFAFRREEVQRAPREASSGSGGGPARKSDGDVAAGFLRARRLGGRTRVGRRHVAGHLTRRDEEGRDFHGRRGRSSEAIP